MTIIAVHNHKGGIGKTTICAHVAWRASDLGIKCLVITLDRQGDVLRYISVDKKVEKKKPVRNGLITGLFSPDEMPPDDILEDYPLVIVDTPPEAGVPEAIDPDLWVVPVDNRTAIENLMSVVPLMTPKAPCYVVFYTADAGGITMLRGLQQAARHVPKVEFYDVVVPFNKAMRRTQGYYVPVWDVAHGEGKSGHRAMVRLCDAILARAGLIDASSKEEDDDDGSQN